MNFVLCGMMACGKTTVGKALAGVLGRPFFDTDEMIAARYGAIADIFARSGEKEFRRLESETVEEAAALDGVVIATGGGAMSASENVAACKKNGKIIFLRASIETLIARLEGDTSRPLLQGECWQETLKELLKKRMDSYLAAADIVVDVDGKTPTEIVAELMKRIGSEVE